MEQWYSNKQLFEMIQNMQEQINNVLIELKELTVLVRDYNGIRGRLNDCEKDLCEITSELTAREQGGKDVWGYVVGAFGILSFIVSLIIVATGG